MRSAFMEGRVMRYLRNVVALIMTVSWLAAAQAVLSGDQAGSGDAPEGFEPLFNGKDLTGWKVHGGKMDAWGGENGMTFTTGVAGGRLSTQKDIDNFMLSLKIKVSKR